MLIQGKYISRMNNSHNEYFYSIYVIFNLTKKSFVMQKKIIKNGFYLLRSW